MRKCNESAGVFVTSRKAPGVVLMAREAEGPEMTRRVAARITFVPHRLRPYRAVARARRHREEHDEQVLRAISGLGVVALLAVSSGAQAAFPGQNGGILFVSGKGAADDTGADLYLLTGPGGADTPIDTRAGQHRHPSWSPDLKRVAYALFDGPSNEKVWVHVLATGQSRPTGTPRQHREGRQTLVVPERQEDRVRERGHR